MILSFVGYGRKILYTNLSGHGIVYASKNNYELENMYVLHILTFKMPACEFNIKD